MEESKMNERMDDKQKQVERLSPDKLLKNFVNTQPLTWVLVAIALHVVIIAGTGYSTILDLINPERVVLREEALKAEREAMAKAQREAAEKAARAADGDSRSNDGGSAVDEPRAAGSGDDGGDSTTPSSAGTGDGGAAPDDPFAPLN
jgi:hypothetical protein